MTYQAEARIEEAYRLRQWEREHTCPVTGCDAAHEDVKPCDCGAMHCPEHLTDGMCESCLLVVSEDKQRNGSHV